MTNQEQIKCAITGCQQPIEAYCEFGDIHMQAVRLHLLASFTISLGHFILHGTNWLYRPSGTNLSIEMLARIHLALKELQATSNEERKLELKSNELEREME